MPVLAAQPACIPQLHLGCAGPQSVVQAHGLEHKALPGMTCRQHSSAEHVHTMFTSMGLRHLVVLDDEHLVCGMITRCDLDYAAGPGGWRRNKVSLTPVQVRSPAGRGL